MTIKMILATVALAFFLPWGIQANVVPAPAPHEVWMVRSPAADRDGNVIPDVDGNRPKPLATKPLMPLQYARNVK